MRLKNFPKFDAKVVMTVGVIFMNLRYIKIGTCLFLGAYLNIF